MRRFAIAALFLLPLAAAAEPETGHHAPTGETGHTGEPGHHEGSHEEAVCTATSSDEQCFEFWEAHINWWSWDYKAGPEQAPEHRHMPPPFGFALINFGVFLLIMYRLAGKPLAEFVRTRHVTIKKDLDEAAALRASAAAKLAEYEAKISGMDNEITTLLAQIRKEAEEEKARIVAAAAEQAARLKTEAAAQIRFEVARTQHLLRTEAVASAIAIAEKLLREKLGADDQKKLADRYVVELEGEKRTTAVRS